MPYATYLLSITPLPLVSVLVWIVLSVAAMYLARRPFHLTMESLGRLIYNTLRLAAASVKISRHRLETRNRETLTAAGVELAERQAERDLERISTMVQRSLAAYPQLDRQLRDTLQRLSDDHQKSAEIPPGLSNWVNVIDAIAGIQQAGDPMVVKVMEDIHRTLKEQHKVALEDHRKSVSARHGILSRMIPQWNSTNQLLKRLEASISRLADRASAVDRSLTAFEQVRAHAKSAQHRLFSSSIAHFFTAGLLLGVFAVVATVNFQLIALPMADMVGGHHFIAGFKSAEVAGVAIVCLHVALGIFLMDAARVTRIFGIVSGMDDRKRSRLFWAMLTMLILLAGVEASLAFIRDRIMSDMQALERSLTGREPSSSAMNDIATMGQVLLGFVLPLIMASSALPLESFLRSMRTVLGMVLVWALNMLTLFLRLTGSMGYYGCQLMLRLYDLIIFPAIWLEAFLQRKLKTIKIQSMDMRDRRVDNSSSLKMVEETVTCKRKYD